MCYVFTKSEFGNKEYEPSSRALGWRLGSVWANFMVYLTVTSYCINVGFNWESNLNLCSRRAFNTTFVLLLVQDLRTLCVLVFLWLRYIIALTQYPLMGVFALPKSVFLLFRATFFFLFPTFKQHCWVSDLCLSQQLIWKDVALQLVLLTTAKVFDFSALANHS